MSLDALYGVGTAAALPPACDFALSGVACTLVSESDDQNGTNVDLLWKSGAVNVADMRIRCTAQRVHYDTLRIRPAFRGQGAYEALCRRLPAFFRPRGVREFTASPDDYGTHSCWLLMLGGFVWDPNRGLLVCDISAGGRMDQLRDWKNAVTGEPQWHADLKTHPPDALADTTSPVG